MPAFKALEEARIASEPVCRRFDGYLVFSVAALLLVVIADYVNKSIPAAVRVDMLWAGQDFAVYFFSEGIQYLSWVLLAFMLFLMRERHVVRALRAYHDSNPGAYKLASELWLTRRRILVYSLTAFLMTPAVVAWFFALTLPELVELFWVIGPLACVASMFTIWGWQYRPIDLAAKESLRKLKRGAWNVGYSYGRYHDVNPVEAWANSTYSEGPVRKAYSDGVKEGSRVRAKLRRGGQLVENQGD